MNLLLVSVDSLRLDSVSRTNPLIHTPHFDRLSQDFCFYDRFFSASSATRPVHASLFTGLYPFENGIEGQRSAHMRYEVPHLFHVFVENGYCVRAFSEVPDLLSGLGWKFNLLDGLDDALVISDNCPTILFLHYWQTHVPYGATDSRAYGETLELLKQGDLNVVRGRYELAIRRVFEREIARLLGKIDLDHWCVIIFGDHGESWSYDEPYHGLSLRNSVLRVPLYLHIPGSGNPIPPHGILSMVDILPTLAGIFDLPLDYRGFGLDLRQPSTSRYCLAQIDPVASGVEPDEDLLIGAKNHGRQWALFDHRFKLTHFVETGADRLEAIFTEEPVHDKACLREMHSAYDALQEASCYANAGPIENSRDSVLDQRLRDLGYM